MATKTKTPTPTPVEKPAPPPLTPATARRHSTIERLAYLATGIAAAAGPQMDNPWMHAAGAAVAPTTLLYLWSRTRRRDAAALLTSCQRALPALGLGASYTAALLASGTSWWEMAAPLGVAALSAVAAPVTRSRRIRHEAAHLPEIITKTAGTLATTPTTGDAYLDGLRQLWEAAGDTGSTTLQHLRHYPGRPDFEAIITAPPGEAVPTKITERVVAAVFDVPEHQIEFADIPGAGPGHRAVRITPTLLPHTRTEGTGPEDLWQTYVSAPSGAAPGVELVTYRVDEDRITLRIAAPRGKSLTVRHDALCSALGIDDPSRVVLEGAGPREALVYIYRINPLLDVREPTAQDLTMDDRGRIAIGITHDGQLAKIQLFDYETGRAQHGISAGTTGAGKSGLMRILGCAQRLSAVISWMADVQGGMSMPEMGGRIDWFARGPEETMTQLRTLHRVKVYRETHSTGRGDFDPAGDWALIQWTGDEINRLLSSLDQEVRKEASWMIADLQKTGQKVGIGVDLAVQSLHLKELGDNHEIREKGKEGHVLLMRTASSSTQSMGLDGIAPAGAHISPIPKRIYEGGGARERFEGTAETEGTPTPGMAWLFTEEKAMLMRTFTLKKVNGRFPQLETLMDNVPLPTLTPGEAQAAGPAYASRGGQPTNEPPTAVEAAPSLDTATNTPGPTDDPDTTAAKPTEHTSAFKKSPTLKEKITAALTDHPNGLRVREIRQAVGCGTDTGPSTGSVNNAVSALATEGLLIACGGGVYRLPDQS